MPEPPDPLPRLRPDLDAIASPLPDTPGLLLRDPLRYAPTMVVVPPSWAHLLSFLDGAHSVRDAQTALTRLAGGTLVESSHVLEFVRALDEAGFLDTDGFRTLKRERQAAFRSDEVRRASHAGSAYPDQVAPLEALLDRCVGGARAVGGRAPNRVPSPLPRAIAAPHVSPEGGIASYRAAYQLSDVSITEEPTFVVLGTSHYGEPERAGVTRKPFVTPLGRVEVAGELVEALVADAGDAIIEEDYCHLPEHSIEFQVLFLQRRLRRAFRIVPLLVGPFVDSLIAGRQPETLDSNKRLFAALAELASRHPTLHWILGVDMAHIGERYGGRSVRANEGTMVRVAERDAARLERVCEGDADGLFELVHPGADELSWCGYSPLYTFLRAVAPVLNLEGSLHHYEQWNIDPGSVVSFGAVHFESARNGITP